LCVLDHRLRPGLAPEQRFALAALARQLASQLELRRALREQRRLVEQKELLFQELNHRIKNSLQIVASMMQLQAASIAGGGESQMVVTAARNRVLTIAELHDQLIRSGELREVEIGGYLQAMLASIVATVSQGADFLQARVEVGQSVSLSTDRAVSVALIVNELVTNAIKHARSDEAPLQVLVRVEPGEGGACCVTVEDNGGGLPADFDPNVGTSLGMRIVLALARQLQGSLTWNTGKHGDRFSLALPPAYS
jgi:two-component sensor histidine kinase